MPSKAKSRKPLVVVDASVLVVGTETVQDWTVSVFSLAYGVGRGNGVDLRLRFAASYPSPSSKESQALRLLHQTAQEIPLLFVTTAMGTESIAQLAADSSFDYVEREHLAQLPMAVRLASNERKLRAALEQPALSVSVGVASYLEDADTIGPSVRGGQGPICDERKTGKGRSCRAMVNAPTGLAHDSEFLSSS